MQAEQPTAKAARLFQSGDVQGALRIASKFKNYLSKEEKAILQRGYECLVRPQFYVQLGKDPKMAIEIAKQLFIEKYINS